MPRHKTAAKLRRASSSPKKARYRGSEKRMAVGSPELRKLISRKQKARWRRHFAEHPETPRKPRRAKLPHDEVHERRATSHRKPVVGISARTGERLRFNSMQAAAEHLFAQGETSSVVAAQLIISQVCNGHRRTGFGYYWEFPHRGRPMTLEMRRRKSGQKREKNSRADKKILKKTFWVESDGKCVRNFAAAVSPNENGGETHVEGWRKGRKTNVTQKCQGYLRSNPEFW